MGIVAALVLLTSLSVVRAYEFELRMRTYGQGYQLRGFRLLSSDLMLQRRIFTQTLSLSLWDLSGRRKGLRLHDPEPKGPSFYFTTYMRLSHDFGAWTGGSLVLDNQIQDAVDVIPELERQSLALDVLYGYLAAEGLADGRIDLRAGRLLEIDTLDWWSLDGVLARAESPWWFAVEAFGGVRVRDSSPAGSSVYELDGTSGAQCTEYVEGAVPGSGSWRPIDRDLPGDNDTFGNDYDYCPQREKSMPTFGGAIETSGLKHLSARVSYRRTESQTVGLIGPADRFEYEDTGFYPNELGQAPAWGVNEERLTASMRGRLEFAGGRGRFTPQAAVRYSLLHATVDEALLGLRLRYREHSLEPEAYYSYPTFDGDSLFNVFSIEPYTDYRLTYEVAPRRSAWRGYARGWLRRYFTEDADRALPSMVVDSTEQAAGIQLGGRYVLSRDAMARLDLFHEDGYGGRRTGAYGSATWRVNADLALSTRLSLVDYESEVVRAGTDTTGSAQLGGTYVINREGVAVHLLVEENSNPYYKSRFLVIAILDLAFNPET